MERVKGVGGIFLYAAEPEKLAAWYREHLGITAPHDSEGAPYHEFFYREDAEPERRGRLTWAIFQGDGKPELIGNSVVNYHVTDLEALLTQLRGAGIEIEKVEDYEYGSFAWLEDPEGNRIELFQDKEF
ncbi:MAG: VOC family protein [Acidobacteriota bacterium]